jgi:hypothetical protein
MGTILLYIHKYKAYMYIILCACPLYGTRYIHTAYIKGLYVYNNNNTGPLEVEFHGRKWELMIIVIADTHTQIH